MIAEKFEVKFRGRIGPGKDDAKDIRILNRMVTWTSQGIEYEADQRHAELIIAGCGLVGNSKPIGTPGTKLPEEEDDEEEVSDEDQVQYRALVARANYLALDRTDIQFAVKELCRSMSSPRVGDWRKLKRLGRYLLGSPRVVITFEYQVAYDHITVWTDSDFAGCHKTRKSTSGGIVMLGRHLIKGWSSTQAVIALSSGEAEYYSLVKGISVGMGIQSMLKEMGFSLGTIRVNTDSSAAKGISNRRGLGKVRHIETNMLWVQEKIANGVASTRKVKGIHNLSDILTKHVEVTGIRYQMEHTSQVFRVGRHALAPQVAE